MSFRDFPFLKEIRGGSLKISHWKGWFCIKCHFPIKTCLRLGTDGSGYCVTKGNICLGVLSFCFNADDLSVNLTSNKILIRLFG